MHVAIVPERAALIVFDMINDFLLPGAPFESVRAREILVPRLKPLLAACRSRSMLVVYTGQANRPGGADLGILGEVYPALKDGKACVAGTAGVEVYPELSPRPEDIVVPKRRFDAFLGTDLELVLRQRAIDTLIITGTSTSVGTESTARAAVARDFRVVFPSDGTVNRDLPDAGWGPVSETELKRVVLTILAQFCRVAPIEEIVREITQHPSRR
jgi:ureidoacrylate peracid hydrolase